MDSPECGTADCYASHYLPSLRIPVIQHLWHTVREAAAQQREGVRYDEPRGWHTLRSDVGPPKGEGPAPITNGARPALDFSK